MDHPHGTWIWYLSRLRYDYLTTLKQQNCQRVYLKVFDGQSNPKFWGFQCTRENINRFHQEHIEVYGWGYHYGSSQIEQEVAAVRQALDCGLDGYILDLEAEVETRSRHENVKRLLQALRPHVKEGTLGYTSFGHPGFHPLIPWKILDELCDLAMPQMYFEKWGFGSDVQEVKEAIDAHKALRLKEPILPIWGSESDTNIPATTTVLQQFLDNYPGSSLWRLPNRGERGEGWNLDYKGEPYVTPDRPLPTEVPAKALFRMDLQDTDGLIVGNLFLFDANDRQIFDAVAVSGRPGHQQLEDLWTTALGPIPNVSGLEIGTEGLLDIESGQINGLFFPISPQVIQNPNNSGITRGGFGIYNEAGAPGTSGGIGIIDANTYQTFCALLENARKARIEKIALKVEYRGRSRDMARPAKALFKMRLANTSQLVTGNLFLFDVNGRQIFDAVATSGSPGYQGSDDLWTRQKGPIPNLRGISIDPNGYHSSLTGVEGMFFPIPPLTFRNPATGETRSEFGVHFDANVPGSAGCIVIRNRQTFDRSLPQHDERSGQSRREQYSARD